MSETTAATAVLTPKVESVFRGLWASVFYAPTDPPKSVVVCATNPGEGATAVACGLALAGAGREERSRVVIVDLNLRSPAVDRRLRLTNGSGVSDVLTGAAELDAALQRVGPGRLDVLTAGKAQDSLLEVLKTDGLRRLMDELTARYDQVVVDTASVNQNPEAQVLAELVGGVVLVARYRHTAREALLQAKRRLEAGGARVLGTVLNQRTYPIPRFLYNRV